MAVNLNKNRPSLLAAWNDVLDDKTATDWALFGYEGLSNDLKVISKGSNGIEEMTEDLNSGQIMYAFLKVIDPKTSLPKNILINWQGEGAPNVRKGTCANHIRDVSNLFKGAHVTINARTEEEVDPQIIIDRVSKSTGSVYNFKERIEHDTETGPVGTSYKRVIPRQEIDSVERDKFWEKEEQEERKRQEEERVRKEEERRKLEFERIRLETEEAANREEKTRERNRNITQIREAEKITQVQEKLCREKLLEDSKLEEKERRERADVLRRQRSQEAQQLIAKRTIDARAVFEQNTCAIQMKNRRSSCQVNGLNKRESHSNNSSEVSSNDQRNEQHFFRKNSLPVRLEGSEAASEASDETHLVDNGIEKIKETKGNNETVEDVSKDQESPNLIAQETKEWKDETNPEISVTEVTAEVEPDNSEAYAQYSMINNKTSNPYLNGEYGLTARALYDYQAEDDTEISFDPGDIITHIDQIDEGWWQGFGPDGVFGLFPANYVELLQ